MREFGVECSNTGCCELLRSLGFSPYEPGERATQRNEQAIVDWTRRPGLGSNRRAASPKFLQVRSAFVHA